MDDRSFGAEVIEVPEEVRVELRGDLNAKADDRLAAAYAQVSALGPRRVSLDFGRVGYINSTASRSSCGFSPTRDAMAGPFGRSA